MKIRIGYELIYECPQPTPMILTDDPNLACRHQVCDRMDRAARWGLKGAEAVLRLRALRPSGDFTDYWSYHVAQEYQRNRVALYADGNVVPVQGRTRPALRRVK